MPTQTPPLPALRSFAALVRLGSITAAAEELNLTQGAISHQIRSLEAFLDVPLVERSGRKLTLTDDGRIYGYQVRQALEDMASATERLKRRVRSDNAVTSLRVGVLPSFATGWLLPRLASFTSANRNVRLSLHASMALADFQGEAVDCAIRFGHGQWPDAQVHPLMHDRLVLVASPALCEKHHPATAAEALKLPLLHASESWSIWLASVSEHASALHRPASFMEFTDSTHMLDAARRGFGAALTRRSIADDLLAKGELVRVIDHECEHPSAYYVLSPRRATSSSALDQFLEWLQTEALRFERTAFPATSPNPVTGIPQV